MTMNFVKNKKLQFFIALHMTFILVMPSSLGVTLHLKYSKKFPSAFGGCLFVHEHMSLHGSYAYS